MDKHPLGLLRRSRLLEDNKSHQFILSDYGSFTFMKQEKQIIKHVSSADDLANNLDPDQA